MAAGGRSHAAAWPLAASKPRPGSSRVLYLTASPDVHLAAVQPGFSGAGEILRSYRVLSRVPLRRWGLAER